ncbi:MAG TPA: response regulator [Anaerolineales bacterium]|nr:response regulator [Anaerolineales bacterium]
MLIIEDDPDIAEVLRYVLKNENFEARVACTGEEGLLVCLDKHNPPALILLDLLLPGMSGIELCRRLRKETLTRSTPVVIVSAKASEKEIVTTQQLGVRHFIVKPFSVREVIACVNSILGDTQPVSIDQ